MFVEEDPLILEPIKSDKKWVMSPAAPLLSSNLITDRPNSSVFTLENTVWDFFFFKIFRTESFLHSVAFCHLLFRS